MEGFCYIMNKNEIANNIVKESLTDALFTLMSNKEFNDITITELSKKAGVSRLSFYRNDLPMDFGFKSSSRIIVRFRNSGSYYEPFNCVFMRMYNNLQKVDPKYHQIHMEELGYVKKLEKAKLKINTNDTESNNKGNKLFTCACFHPNQIWIFSGGEGGKIRMWC